MLSLLRRCWLWLDMFIVLHSSRSRRSDSDFGEQAKLYSRVITRSRSCVIRETESDRTISTAISASTEVDYCCFTSKSSIFLCSKIFLVHMWLISTEFDLKSASLLMKSQKISPSNRANVIGELMCFFGLSCKFYWVFSFVTFAQKHKFIRMTQILRYYTNIAGNVMFVKRKHLLLPCIIFHTLN